MILRKARLFTLGLTLIGLSLFSATEEKEIIIQVGVEKQLEPLYLTKVAKHSTSLSAQYLESIQEILDFDFSYNGRTRVLKDDEAKRKQLQQDLVELEFNYEAWRALNISYILHPTISDNKLSCRVIDTLKRKSYTSTQIILSGNLNDDRRRLHQLADEIHLALFQARGIASTKILFTLMHKSDAKDSYKWKSEMWECDYDGGNARQITRENNYCVTPTYIHAREGKMVGRFLYVSYKIGQPKIYIGSTKDSITERLNTLKGNQFSPAITQQLDKVAFICDAPGSADLFLQDFSPNSGALGKPKKIFSAPNATEASPTFSPDGHQIAFVSDKDGGTPRIYTMEVPKGLIGLKKQVRLITRRHRENTAPAWSPDGSKIAYSSQVDGVRQIFYYDCMTEEEKQVTAGPGNKENPIWASDSLHIIFNTADDHSSELFLINTNQKDIIRISAGPGHKRFPAWQY